MEDRGSRGAATGNAGSPRATQRKPQRASSSAVRLLVELAQERGEPRGARRIDQVRAPARQRTPQWQARSPRLASAPRTGDTRAPRRGAPARPPSALRARRSSLRHEQRAPGRGPKAANARRPASAARRPPAFAPVARSRSLRHAASTRSRTAADPSPGAPARSSARGRGTVKEQVEAVKERARELLAVALNPLGRA